MTRAIFVHWGRLLVSLLLFSFSVCQAATPVYLNTTEGIDRLSHADMSASYYLVMPYVDTQENLGFCAPASIAGVLNSLPNVPRPSDAQYKPYSYFTQANLFNKSASQVKPYNAVVRSGLTLTQAAQFLDAHGVDNRVYYGSDLTLNQFRDLVKEALQNPHERLIANFDRGALEQEGAGHFSPLVAYDSASDSVLISDVAKFKYPPFWVSLTEFLNAINTIDPDSNESRGVIAVFEPY